MLCYMNYPDSDYTSYVSNFSKNEGDYFVCDQCKQLFQIISYTPISNFLKTGKLRLISKRISNNKNMIVFEPLGIRVIKNDDVLLLDFGNTENAIAFAKSLEKSMKNSREGKYFVSVEGKSIEYVEEKMRELGII